MAIDSLIIMCQRYIISWEMVVSKAASFRYQKKIARATFKGIRALTTLTEMGSSYEIMGQRSF